MGTQHEKSNFKEENNYISFSLGYEGKTIDEYLNLLIKNNIQVIFDVRRNPISRKFGFSKSRLSTYAENIHVKYIHLPSLGVPSKYRKNLITNDDRKNLFKFYAKYILNKNSEGLELIRNNLLDNKRIVLTCFESDFRTCHRKIICDLLTREFNIDFIHL